MEPRSLALRTDLMLARFDGEVVDRGTYTVIRTPSNPGFWWGNYLLFADPPTERSVVDWPRLFEEELGCRPGIEHVAMAWDTVGPDGSAAEAPEGVVEAFVAAGFELESDVALSARELHLPPRPNPDVTVRPVDGDAEWSAVLEVHFACAPDRFEPQGFRRFLEAQWRRYRRMVAAGLGLWYGAFLGDELVADMGVFAEHGLGRCQSVGTAPAHRRKGICGTLVHAACSHAFEHLGAERIVILAAADQPPARVYRSVGFGDPERVWAITRAGSRTRAGGGPDPSPGSPRDDEADAG